MFLNTIYTTFQGEVNPFGIGFPVIFLRLQGCHLRCYKKTLGVLCDTPEGLDKPIAETKISYIFAEIEKVSEKYVFLNKKNEFFSVLRLLCEVYKKYFWKRRIG